MINNELYLDENMKTPCDPPYKHMLSMKHENVCVTGFQKGF